MPEALTAILLLKPTSLSFNTDRLIKASLRSNPWRTNKTQGSARIFRQPRRARRCGLSPQNTVACCQIEATGFRNVVIGLFDFGGPHKIVGADLSDTEILVLARE